MEKVARNRLPSKDKIAAYWNGRIEQLGVFVPMQAELEEISCWACGRVGIIERCHVVDYAHGGANAVENLVLLCPGCHAESENLSEPAFWNWLRHSRQNEWMDGASRILSKMRAIGYTNEKMDEMIREMGEEAAMRVIKEDLYSRMSQKAEVLS